MQITDPYNIQDDLNNCCKETDPEKVTARRTEILIAANEAIAERKKRFPTRQIEIERSAMRRPLGDRESFAYLGAMLGVLPPATLFILFMSSQRNVELWVPALLVWVTIVTGATGYFTGNGVGRLITRIRHRTASARILLVILIGFIWGAVSGATGGVFILLIGSIFGGVIGGLVGAAALTVFVPLYNLTATAGTIDTKHFLPLAAGTVLSICAFFIGLAIR